MPFPIFPSAETHSHSNQMNTSTAEAAEWNRIQWKSFWAYRTRTKPQQI